MSIKVLLDTDIGGDIDDAICLAYLLAQPECELLGITTVSGEAEKRAMLASAQCKVAGKKIPIYPGAPEPLLIAQKQQIAHQARALSKWDHDTSFPEGEAIEFLQRTIRQHPGEVVLLCIGPLTNIALLFRSDPAIPSLLKGLVLMCGYYSHGGPAAREWNALLDPHATAIVYRATPLVHRSIGLDVTLQVTMKAEQFRERCQTPLLRPVLDFAEVFFEENDTVTFHDPLAATTIFAQDICDFEAGTVEVEFSSERLGGLTYWEAGGASPRHEIATKVRPERFFEHYFGVFA
jgi:purine nucleosidase